MKSWQLQKTGRENLHLVDIPEPKPRPNEILVRTTAVSLNFRDKRSLRACIRDHSISRPCRAGS
jgi:NADPH:quinone reductase-like Zn-dependent oxidoreductase